VTPSGTCMSQLRALTSDPLTTISQLGFFGHIFEQNSIASMFHPASYQGALGITLEINRPCCAHGSAAYSYIETTKSLTTAAGYQTTQQISWLSCNSLPPSIPLHLMTTLDASCSAESSKNVTWHRGRLTLPHEAPA
jgi:hypothetical protein